MEAVKGGAGYGVPRGGPPAVTKKNPGKDATTPAAGWDPFEVWRTRVRDVQQARERAAAPEGKR